MSDVLKHECGFALLRLLKPIDYYKQKYGTIFYGLKRMYVLMEKQRNRGQEGAGLAGVKLDIPLGLKYIDRVRSCESDPIQDVFSKIDLVVNSYKSDDIKNLKEEVPFISDLFLGHLRYATFGKNNIEFVHPLKRASNWRSRNLILAANFNLTNVDELFEDLINVGQHPRNYSDTVTLLEKVGFSLDDEIQNRYRQYRDQGYSKKDITPLIEENLDLASVLQNSSSNWDGGYAVAGIIGHGDAFVFRDPWGIRPAYYYADDEIIVSASEASVIRTAFGVDDTNIKEIPAGDALIIKKNGNYSLNSIREAKSLKSCSFERIYFSRGNDRYIYRERKLLGELLSSQIMDSIKGDIKNTIFSFIPNTAETAFYGMIDGIKDRIRDNKLKIINDCVGSVEKSVLLDMLDTQPRVEKIVIKDAKLRTFITSDSDRDEMVGHVYDVTYGVVKPSDNLVVIDDSIVRGTTLKKSILRILDSLNPKKIIIVSSAPQIRYPDCYGIDMNRMGEFIAFNAAIELLKERGMESVIEEVYIKCKAQQNNVKESIVNYVKDIYKPFSDIEISNKIAQMIKSKSINAKVEVIFQKVSNLHIACKNNSGDWYFTGDYPTPGGNKVVNTAYINWVEGINERSY